MPLDCEITEIPLPVNGDRTSVNDDRKLKSDSSDLGESNGGGRDLPRALPAADRSSKIRKFLVVVFSTDGVPGGRDQLENDECEWRNKIQVVVYQKSGGINGGKNGPWPRVFELKSSAFWSISDDEDSGDRTVGFQASDRYQAWPVRWSESGEIAGSRSRFRVGFAGQMVPTHSLSLVPLSLSLAFKNNFPPFPVIKPVSFFSLFFPLNLNTN